MEEFDGKEIRCPYCGTKLKIEYDTAKCSCGWSAFGTDLQEIMQDFEEEKQWP